MAKLDPVFLGLNAYNLVVALLVFLDGIIDFFHFWSFSEVVIDLYCIAASLIIVLLETIGSPRIVEYVPIMKKWLGRGILYIILGVLGVGHYVDETKFVFSLVAGILVIVLGVIAIFLHFFRVEMSIPLVVHIKGEQSQVRWDSEVHSGDRSYQKMPTATDSPSTSSTSIAPAATYSFQGESTSTSYQSQIPSVQKSEYETL